MTDAAADAVPTGEKTPAGKAYYVTTPIYYVSAAPHIGNAYTTVAGDVLTRWHRQRGEDVWFLTGTDEHGEKVLRSAEAAGKTAKEFTDDLVENAWKPVLQTIDSANDDFIRTTEPRHTRRVQEFWSTLNEKGDVYQGSYEGPYCVPCEEFKLESELVEGENGEQALPHPRPPGRDGSPSRTTSSGSRRTPTSCSPSTSRTPTSSSRPAPATRSSRSSGRACRTCRSPGRRSTGASRSRGTTSTSSTSGSTPCSTTLTAAGYGDEAAAEKFARTWPADVHLVGKDILRFHAVIWPAMLLAAGVAAAARPCSRTAGCSSAARR